MTTTLNALLLLVITVPGCTVTSLGSAFSRNARIIEAPDYNVRDELIIELAARRRLPAMYPFDIFVRDGGLMSYGVNFADLLRRAVNYVDKILKGARPGDVPIEQPMKYELLVNLKTAKALGLTIPATILLQADQTLE